ncbi:glycosyltransferase family 87 protein [Limnoglobus roseus]|uniref:DUF2029 domain-containing protein n=1 Tax=Limnoglobus roseus TaxID=2598579 RepID=A0A5C1AA72_9BACT|nr:glycosyltransferase family 87 protein [Limnoglobus roseus]QEL14926.1 hypothetical protein PX52LOC_01827 [Limnoglobus roseus]
MPEVTPSIRTPFRWPFVPAKNPAALLRLVFGLSVAVIVLLTAVRYYAKAEKPSRLGDLTRTAFLRWRPQIQALDSGTNIYAAFNYPNPPIMALILYPLAELPPLVGAMTWFALKVVMALAMVAWAFSLIRNSEFGIRNEIPDWAKAVAVVLALHPILGDLAHGNVNLLIAFLVTAALALFCRRWDFSAGVVLALAIACKVTPALFVPYFVWKRAWRSLLGVVAGLALWLAVVPGAVLGWEYNQTLLTSWYVQMVKPFVVDGKVTTEHPNQSIPGVVFRLLTAEPSFVDYDDDEGKQFATGFNNFASLSPDGAQAIVKSLMVVFAAAVVLFCRWPTHRADVPRAGPMLAAEFSLILLGMLLFSERTWKHHAVTLIVPFAALAWAATSTAVAGRDRIVLRCLYTTVGLLMLVPSLLPEHLQDLSMVYGCYTAAYALTAVGVAYLLATTRKILTPAT